MANRGINKVILVGNLGADPECRTFQNGDLVANFSLATSETWQDKNTGEQREKTEWHRCVVFRGLAGVVQQYVRKGSKLYVEGKLQTRKWQDQNGLDRYTTEIVVDELQMLDSRNNQGQWSNDSSTPYQNESTQYRGQTNYGQSNHQAASGNRALPQTPVPPNQEFKGPAIDDNFGDDEIPF